MLSSASDESRSTNLSASESKNLRYSNEKLKQALSQRYLSFDILFTPSEQINQKFSPHHRHQT